MFDAATAQLLRSAPAVPGLDPEDIPAELTRHYANLVSARLRGTDETADDAEEEWSLARIADTYELIASLQDDGDLRRASAFVAGTARQILSRRKLASPEDDAQPENINRDRVDPSIAAALLFLAAEQYADANEAASAIQADVDGQLLEAKVLSENIADLARGRLGNVLQRVGSLDEGAKEYPLEEQALAALLATLNSGVELLAAGFLGVPVPPPISDDISDARDAFERVLELSAVLDSQHQADLGGSILNTYAGPHHLAALLLAAHDGLDEAPLTNLPPPDGADPEFWSQWLRFRAGKFPFVWPNHREAIAKGFHQTGRSAVAVLPTGAGKTTVSSIKIAGVLARKKKAVFLAPTHALVEQLTDDLQEMFPEEILGSIVSSDFDRLFQTEAQLREIEVMTPERCLAMLSFAPESFADVGLLVFDECHLLSPQTGKIRRALDGMLCVLAFNHIAPDADLLFLSAMLKNSEEFADWIAQLSGRDCVCVDLLWKPSRQARGVVIYQAKDLEKAKKAAAVVQVAENKKKGKQAKGLRAKAVRELVAKPWAIWGLQHNWLGQKTAHCIMSKVLDDPVALAGDKKYGHIHLTPNANHVAARLAVSAARNNIKSIVFVNTKNDAVSVARDISSQLGETVDVTEAEEQYWAALDAELGDLGHALLPEPSVAVPHNSSMLRLERELAERMFKRANGAKVIVATPTLAQGLNLPAHLAILAGDKRAKADQSGREELEAHEILNAAARAGRAGHLANGIVLLIPEPLISFSDEESVAEDVIEKLQSVLPEDDRCVVISDPIEIVLDRLMQGDSLDIDVRYMVNRLAPLHDNDTGEEATVLFDLGKSLGAVRARKRAQEDEFEAKIAQLKKTLAAELPEGGDSTVAALASQSGLPMDLLSQLKQRVAEATGSLPLTIEEWLIWTFDWLSEDEGARRSLLYDVKNSVLGACGCKKDGEIGAEHLALLLPGLLAWMRGIPIAGIEQELGGDPGADARSKKVCPRARELVGGVIPRGIAFVMGLVGHVVEEVDPFEDQENLSRQVIETLGTAVRKGYDTPEKVLFAGANPGILCRVQMHQEWMQQKVDS